VGRILERDLEESLTNTNKEQEAMKTRDTILKQFAVVMEESSPVSFPHEISDDVPLDRFWIDSIAFVALISRLDEELGYIPVTLREGTFEAKTFGEFVALYTEAAQEQI
jgi:hypothetical protein